MRTKKHAFDCSCVIHTPFTDRTTISKTRRCSCGVGNPHVDVVPTPHESEEEKKAEAFRRWNREFGSAANGRKGGRPKKVKP